MIAVHDSYTASIAVTARLSSLGYSGEHFDAQAQQQYLRARFYDPTNGRFNRLDPFAGNMQDPQSLHKYSYVHGDPIGNSDPSGLMSLGSVSVAVGIGGAALTLGYNISKGFAYGFEGEYSPTNIAKKTTLAFALGFGFTYAIGWWATLAVSGGASVAVVKAAVAGMTLPGIAMLTIANYVEAEKHGDEIDQYFAKLDILLLAVGGTRAARAKLAPLKPRNRIRTFRIEGDPNTRIHIDEAGNVMIIEPDKTLYLTFGDEVRAQQYLAQKLGPGQKLGPLPNGRAKSFEVTQEFVDKIRADAVTEQQLSLDPSLKGRPLVADPTKTADSFGLRPDQIKELEKVIVQGTGQDPHTFGNGGS